MEIEKHKEYDSNQYCNYFDAQQPKLYSRELEEIDITNIIRQLK